MDKNKLLKICRVQEITYGLQHRGFTKEHIYKHFIYPVYFISKRTFDSYMTIKSEQYLLNRYKCRWEDIREEFVPKSYESMLQQLAKRGMSDNLFATQVELDSLDFHIKTGCKK